MHTCTHMKVYICIYILMCIYIYIHTHTHTHQLLRAAEVRARRFKAVLLACVGLTGTCVRNKHQHQQQHQQQLTN